MLRQGRGARGEGAKPSKDGKPGGEVRINRGAKTIKTYHTATSIPNNFCWFMDFAGDDVWVATSKGLARGIGAGRWAGLKPADSARAPNSGGELR